MIACSGGSSAAPDASPLDAPTPDAAPDAPPLDAPTPDASTVEPPPPCSQVTPLIVTAPRSVHEFMASVAWVGYVAAFQLDTPVPLESLWFSHNRARTMNLYASCPGAHVASAVPGDRMVDIALLEWSEGVATNLPAGSYVVEIFDGPAPPPTAQLELRGVIADGAACTSPLVASGVLQCSERATCTGGVCVVAACGNGLDDDGDGLVDVDDPGCARGDDGDEADACGSGGPCPACGDGVDDDGDGSTGWPEPGCRRAGDPIEHDCPDVDGVIDVKLRGPYAVPRTGTADHPFATHCWGGGVDRVFQLRVPGDLSTLAIGVGQQAFTLTLYRGACEGAPVACFPAVPGWSAMTTSNLAAGEYWLVAAAAFDNTDGIAIDGTLVPDAPCDPTRPAFACASGQSCQPVSGGGARCQ